MGQCARHGGPTSHQGRGGIIASFSLEYSIARDYAQLADYPISRANIVGLRYGTLFRAQRTGKKIIERPIAVDVRIYRFIHIHPVMLNKPANDKGGDAAGTGVGNMPGQHGHCLLGQQILRQY